MSELRRTEGSQASSEAKAQELDLGTELNSLTAASSREEMPVQPAFSYDISVAESRLTMLTQNKIKQVTQRQTLLVAPIDINENQDIAMEHLSSKLLQKNSSVLKFVCDDLDCLPVLSCIQKANYATTLVN
jgi:hypothetical protein